MNRINWQFAFAVILATAVGNTTALAQIVVNPMNGTPSGLSQDIVQIGSGPLTLTVRGSGFSGISVIRLGTSSLTTMFIDSATLMTTIPPGVITSTGALSLVVVDGTQTSNIATFGSNNSNHKSVLISGTTTPLLVNHVYYSDLPGEPVLIEGTGFNAATPGDNQVLFTTSSSAEVAGTVVMAGRTELIALVPSGAVTGVLKVKTNNGQNVSNDFNFRAAGSPVSGPFNGRIEYAYDVLNRLTEVRYPYTLIRYTYDSAGNRLSMVVSPR